MHVRQNTTSTTSTIYSTKCQTVHDTDHPCIQLYTKEYIDAQHYAIMHSNVQLAHSKHAGIMHSNVSLARGAALDCRFAGKRGPLASIPLELITLGLRECWLAEVKPFRRTAR